MKPTPIPVERILALEPACLRMTIPEAYRDGNGHMNVRWYAAIFDEAGDRLHERLGLTPKFHRDNGTGTMDLENQINYLREVIPGERIAVFARLVEQLKLGLYGECATAAIFEYPREKLHSIGRGSNAGNSWTAGSGRSVSSCAKAQSNTLRISIFTSRLGLRERDRSSAIKVSTANGCGFPLRDLDPPCLPFSPLRNPSKGVVKYTPKVG